jgi:hypothetical protein
MNSVTITIPDERWLKLQEIAASLNVSVEDLVLIGIEDLLSQREASLQNIKVSEISSAVASRFYQLAEQWQSEVEGMSSTTKMSQHPAYPEIINMGNQIVPLLLSELKHNPLYWLSALKEITGVDPITTEQRGRVKQMAESWLEWGKNQGYII